MNRAGMFIISLDFELNWGVHDVFTMEQYKENLLGARDAIPKMLDLFQRYGIHATWATVGMLNFDSKEKLLNHLPDHLPSYENTNFSPYGKLGSIGENEEEDPFHFASSLLGEIEKYPNQELASHTFSHYYCLENGQTIEQFEADLKASLEVSSANGHRTKSLVFPRNQTNNEYLNVCKKYGIQCFRGNEESWIYRASSFHNEGYIKRALRLLDCYINIFGHHSYPIENIDTRPIVNLPSSRFLRPYSTRLKVLENMRLRRIKKSIMNAARKGEVFHLWWHPHNFGKDIDENMRFLGGILELVSKLRKEFDFESLNMGEACTQVLRLNGENSLD